MYERPLGMPEDDGEAANWYRKAAERGLAEAQWDLSLLYRAGLGVPISNTWAYAWMKLAAVQGHQSAGQALGLLESDMTTVQIAEGQSLAGKIAVEMAFRDR